jgi:hypothetical protein
MKWEKKGRIFEPKGQFEWMRKYGIVPTPVYLRETNSIRIFFATATSDNIGRITYMDVEANNPSNIIKQPDKILLYEGEPGTFDDCGVNPTSFVVHEGKEYLYYVGYERSFKVPFTLFPGISVGNVKDGFKRVKHVPFIDRSEKYPYSLAAPFVLIDKNKFKLWLWLGVKWVKVNGKDYLSAKIGYAESENGLDFKILHDNCIVPNQDNEFSVGRPWVIKDGSIYKMFYSVRYVDKLYRLGYAESDDGINWIRKDEQIGIDVSSVGWDSEMICYPAVVKTDNKTFLFYNGNNNGISGFGYAELVNE